MTPASSSARSTIGVIVSMWARLASSGTTPPKAACRSIWLATTDERTAKVSSTTAAAVSSHDVSMASSSRVTAPRASAPATWAREIAPSRSTTGIGRPHVDQRRRHVGERPAVDDEVHGGAEAGRHVVSRARRGRAVGVGAGHHEHAGLRQQRPQEVVVGDAHRHLVPAGQPGRAARARRRSRRPASAVPATTIGPALAAAGVKATPRARTCATDAASTGRCIPSGRPLAEKTACTASASAGPRRQPVHGVGRHHDDAAGAQHLGGGQRTFGVGAHDRHGAVTARCGSADRPLRA